MPPVITGISPATAPVGVPVVVSGSGFGGSQGGSTITFNGVAGTPTSWVDGSITVPVPTGALSGNVIVTVSSVQSNPQTFVVIHAVVLTADVTVITPAPPTPPSTPQGTVQFYDGQTPIGTPQTVVNGIATYYYPYASGDIFVSGFGAFDKQLNTSGNNTPQTGGPLTPAATGEWAIMANTSQGSYQPTTGFVNFSNFLGIMPVPTTSPVSFSNAVSNFGWLTNMVLFSGQSYPLTCTISSIKVVSNVVTVTTSSQSFIIGTQIAFPAGLNASFLNNQVLQILTNTGTSITVAFTHANYGPVAESSPTLTNYPYLQVAINPSIGAPPISITFANAVQAGSTILAATLYGDWNAHFNTSSVSDGANTYTIFDATGPGTGLGPLAFLNLYFARNASTGPRTVTVNASSHNYATGATFVAFELPGSTTQLSPTLNIGTHELSAVFTPASTEFITSTSTPEALNVNTNINFNFTSGSQGPSVHAFQGGFYAGLYQTPSLPTWPSSSYAFAGVRIVDSNGNLQVATNTGITSGSHPVWNTNLNGLTTDSGVVWIMKGPPYVISKGDTLYMACHTNNSSSISSIVDSLGNTWTPLNPIQTYSSWISGTVGLQTFSTVATQNVLSGTEYDIVWTLPANVNFGVVIAGVSGLVSVDHTTYGVNAGPTGGPFGPPSITFPTREFVFAAITNDFTTGANAALGFNRISTGSGAFEMDVYYAVFPVGGTSAPTQTQLSGGAFAGVQTSWKF